MTRRKKNPLRNRIYSKFLELTSQEMYSRQLWELTLRYEGERITLVITTCTQFIFIHFGERTALHSFKELQDMYVFFIILKALWFRLKTNFLVGGTGKRKEQKEVWKGIDNSETKVCASLLRLLPNSILSNIFLHKKSSKWFFEQIFSRGGREVCIVYRETIWITRGIGLTF